MNAIRKKISATLALALCGVVLASCVSSVGPDRLESELAAMPPPRDHPISDAELSELTNAAKAIALSNMLLYRALSESLPSDVKEQIAQSLEAQVPEELGKEVEVDYVGPAQEILRSLARQADYKVEERGAAPGGTDIVRVKGRDKLSSLFRYIGSQVPWLVVIDPTHKMILFDYQNVTTIEQMLEQQKRKEAPPAAAPAGPEDKHVSAPWASELRQVSEVMDSMKHEVAKTHQQVQYFVTLGPYPNEVEAKWAKRRARKNGLTLSTITASVIGESI